MYLNALWFFFRESLKKLLVSKKIEKFIFFYLSGFIFIYFKPAKIESSLTDSLNDRFLYFVKKVIAFPPLCNQNNEINLFHHLH